MFDTELIVINAEFIVSDTKFIIFKAHPPIDQF